MDRVLASTAALAACLVDLESRVRAAVAARRATDDKPNDSFRGLYLDEADVGRVLDRRPQISERWRPLELLDGAGVEGSGLQELAANLGLDDLDAGVLLVALAPDLDRRFEQLYGYLQDDVTRRRAGIGLAFALCGSHAHEAGQRGRLLGDAVLLRHGLVVVEEPDRPFLTRSLRVPDAVSAWVLGSEQPAPDLLEWLRPIEAHPSALTEGIARARARGVRFFHLHEPPGTSGVEAFAAALDGPVVNVVLDGISPEELKGVARAAAREARIRDATLIIGPLEILATSPRAIRALVTSECELVVWGAASWDASWSEVAPLVVGVEPPSPAEREALWRRNLNGAGGDLGAVAEDTAQFRLSPPQIRRAARAASLGAIAEDRPLAAQDLHHGARSQTAVELERLARRIEPSVGWDDLVVPAEVAEQLREISMRVRHRERVLDQWGMRRGGAKGEGVAALFVGESGTGKTMAAEVIAGDLGLHLYTIDLATVVDKYIGETEKNLKRIFHEAQAANAVLFFDEADALFGKRSEVKDAHDRYANVETAYLLQRMESFDGVAILATNLPANLDDAFARRLDKVVVFPAPTAEHRRALWERSFPVAVPLGDDVDLDFCAGAFEITGGSIRNVALAAAYSAAEADRPVGMADLIRAVEHEYQKLGRLCREEEFGSYYELVHR